ncbi:TRAP transporter small permease subunit [Kaustia mangrovi]|uniref:TRAP transporter small permease protein n=1 Tax=Kaustia mangrovi TaxID=2593653 RepID=A0A7S8C3K5_9HYPH|nr:TRAP transporter small permease subunit [Kaustia mangrovi]
MRPSARRSAVRHAGPRARRGLELATAALSVGLIGLMIWKGLGLIRLTAYDRYTALDLSLQYLYWSLVVGGGLWIVTTVIAVWRPANHSETPEQ